MKTKYQILSSYIFLLFLLVSCFGQNSDVRSKNEAQNKARLKTTKGDIVLEFYKKEAPITVERIKSLIKNQFYDGLTFHKVIKDFIVQTGDPTKTGTGGSGENIPFEKNNLTNKKGSVSLARGEELNSGDSQFFISLKDDLELDKNYTIFAIVIKGLENAQSIEKGDKILTIRLEK